MGFTDSTYKKIKGTVEQLKKQSEGKEQQVSNVFTAAENLVTHALAHGIMMAKTKASPNELVKRVSAPLQVGSWALRWNLMTKMAGAIDRLLEEPVQEEAPAEEIAEEVAPEEVCCEVAEEEPIVEDVPAEEPAVEAYAEVATEPAAVDGENEDEDDEDSLDGIDTAGLEFIDVMAEPERYSEMLAQEARGEVRLVSRYRRSYRSRMIQSRDNVQEYYSILKNALLSYKGVKERTSWDFESFNKGRAKVAKINAKTRTLYLYLAIDPAELQDSKYFFDDMSDKKKYAEVPVLMKIRGERKLKHALELIEKICGEQMQLPPVKNFEAQDYIAPYQDTASLVQEGLIKQFTAAIPVVAIEAATDENADVTAV